MPGAARKKYARYYNMKIDFQKLCQGLTELGLLNIAPADMSKEQIEQLCQIARFCTTLEGAQDVPF